MFVKSKQGMVQLKLPKVSFECGKESGDINPASAFSFGIKRELLIVLNIKRYEPHTIYIEARKNYHILSNHCAKQLQQHHSYC